MLQIKNISKKYVTGELVQTALSDVSLSFRDNEFVAILGPSGSGKTTLLNIVGGLDRYDDGDLIINGISTKKYKDKDWDSYRNHTIGFVFQSYNLIPHQSVLSNVELALTISGVSKAERRKRAEEALEKVGLAEHIHKRPNQLSGGQMQRVAIARALVNNPDILLADEPTGALDSETSVQVMNMLAEVAKDRLVIMVTHNPELAEQYATRTVKLRDGKITSDSNPVEAHEEEKEPEHKNMGKTSMSFLTSLSLSFNNLRTKKGRTLLTSFAGSIGIIGIALILSLSNGVNTYITDIQRSAMSSYPITIDSQSIDLSSLVNAANDSAAEEGEKKHENDAVYSNNETFQAISDVATSITENNLTKFKTYLDDPKSEIHKSVGENGIVYSYATKFNVYNHDPEGKLVNINRDPVVDADQLMAMNPMSSFMDVNSSMKITSNMSQLIPGADGSLAGPAVEDNYDLVYGSYPTKYDEIVLVLTKNNEVDLDHLYQFGLLPVSEYKEYFNKINKGEKLDLELKKWSYEDICKQEFLMVPACDMYKKTGNTYSVAETDSEIEDLLENAVHLKISAVIRHKKDSDATLIRTPLAYTKALTDYLMSYTDNSEIVRDQKANKDVNVITGMKFSPSSDEEKINDFRTYITSMGISEKAKFIKNMTSMMAAANPQIKEQMDQMDETQLAMQFDAYMLTAEDSILLQMYDMYVSTGTYEDNLKTLGVVSPDAPSSIAIYSDSFEAKDRISKCIEEYNETVEEKDKIVYTDYVGLLMSSITTIIDVISYVLIAFVAVSLIVSSIMIGIITYISVLERTKEIGILRAIGASKRNISQVFNAETFIIGLCSGIIGIGISILTIIPANIIIHIVANNNNMNAILPPVGAVALIILSMVLTLIGGFIPAKKAAKQDPVKALRTE